MPAALGILLVALGVVLPAVWFIRGFLKVAGQPSLRLLSGSVEKGEANNLRVEIQRQRGFPFFRTQVEVWVGQQQKNENKAPDFWVRMEDGEIAETALRSRLWNLYQLNRIELDHQSRLATERRRAEEAMRRCLVCDMQGGSSCVKCGWTPRAAEGAAS